MHGRALAHIFPSCFVDVINKIGVEYKWGLRKIYICDMKSFIIYVKDIWFDPGYRDALIAHLETLFS